MNKKLLLIGLTIVHFSAANLITASSSSTTSSSDKPKKSAPAKLLCLLCNNNNNSTVFDMMTLATHLATQHTDRFECPYNCGNSRKNVKYLYKHIREEHQKQLLSDPRGPMTQTQFLTEYLLARGIVSQKSQEAKRLAKKPSISRTQEAQPSDASINDDQAPTTEAAFNVDEFMDFTAFNDNGDLSPALEIPQPIEVDSTAKYCNCIKNSPSCIQCHLSETHEEDPDSPEEDLDSLIRLAAQTLPSQNQSTESPSATESLLGKHDREESDDATTPSDSTKIKSRTDRRRIKTLNNNVLCLQCKEIFINDVSVRKHLKASHKRTAYLNKDYAYLPKQQSYTPEVINAAIVAAAKNAAKAIKKDSRQRREALRLYQFQCLHCDSIKNSSSTMQSHLRDGHKIKSFKMETDYERIPGTSSQTIINGEKS